MLNKLIHSLLIFAVTWVSAVSQAEITVGGEFEFISPHAPDIKVAFGLKGYEEQMAKIFADELRSQCRRLGCTEFKVEGKWAEKESRFVFKQGFWIQVSWDPNVVEIQTKPLTLSRARKLSPILEEVIFKTAYYSGFVPSPKRAGHFNFGALSAFDGDPDLFLRFVIDYSNRPELAAGILRETNLMTAPPLAALASAQREAFAAIASQDVSEMTIPQLSQKLLDEVFYQTHREQLTYEYAIHNQALGLKKVPDATAKRDQPMEIRAVRSQMSFEDFIRLGELIEARIAYLKTLPASEARNYQGSSRIDFTSQELVDRFYVYVTETGLPWRRYKSLLPKELRPLAVSKSLIGPRVRPLAPRCEAAFSAS